MARSGLSLTEKQITERYADGRGSGELAGYRPFIDHHDISSLGLASRVPSVKTGRLHHFLSNVETLAFYEFIRMPQVADVREQFPLDREDTCVIAAEMGVPHPVYPKSQVPMVMTTDLLVIVREGGQEHRFARAGKMAGDLEDERTLEKLEIERRYWERRDVHWGLVTELDRSRNCGLNLEWMHGMEVLDDVEHSQYWPDRISSFEAAFRRAKTGTFDDLEQTLVDRGQIALGEIINVIRFLCANNRMSFDLDEIFDMRWPVGKLTLCASSAQRSRAA